MKPQKYFWILIALILFSDQITKIAVSKWLAFNQNYPVILHFFDITLVHNDGIAFGFFQGKNELFILLALLILSLGIYWSRKLNWQRTEINVIAAMILSGALGNLIDRIRIGHVIDFLDFHWKEIYHWPAFNIADSCISLSVAYIILRTFFIREKIDDTPSSH